MLKLLVALLIGLLAWKFLLQDERVELGPGVRAPDAPHQSPPRTSDSFELKGYRITPLAEFRINAKVLSRETYSLGHEAELSPLDLALGWGPMSDEELLQRIRISQFGRWYRWRAPTTYPIARREIETHSANMHMIPADDDIEDALEDVREGQVIELSGQLVGVRADDGWHWTSSLTREDTGARSCELVYVERVRIID
ncbi:MAG: hypothetical protein WBM71_17875 [Sedimenticolaceae bacterium]